MRITGLTTFSGCGGSALGMKQAGVELVFALDRDRHSIDTYKLNFGKHIYNKDFNELTGSFIAEKTKIDKGELSIFQASPPCQGFSRNNSKRGEGALSNDDRNDLMKKTAELIGEVQPQSFWIENVPGLTDAKLKRFYDTFKWSVSKLNYVTRATILDASNFNVPQRRQRIIFIGVRQDIAETLFGPYVKDNAAKWYEKTSILIPEPTSFDLPTMFVRNICNDVEFYASTQFGEKKIPAGTICTTLTSTPQNLYFVTKSGERRWPTIEELKIISSFPKSFKFPVTDNSQSDYLQAWRRMGNSVPPGLSFAITNNLINKILLPYYEKVGLTELAEVGP